MALLNILRYPDARLHKLAAPVTHFDASLKQLVADMAESMYAAPGIGLAATQVDVHKQVIVIDVSERRDSLVVLINPEIVKLSSAMRVHDEGCLSIPDVRVEIERPSALTLTYLDRDGKKQQLDAEGILATAIQHELETADPHRQHGESGPVELQLGARRGLGQEDQQSGHGKNAERQVDIKHVAPVVHLGQIPTQRRAGDRSLARGFGS